MKLKEQYARESEKTKPENTNKISISDDAYAICEFLEYLKAEFQKIGARHG